MTRDRGSNLTIASDAVLAERQPAQYLAYEQVDKADEHERRA